MYRRGRTGLSRHLAVLPGPVKPPFLLADLCIMAMLVCRLRAGDEGFRRLRLESADYHRVRLQRP
jgi:hypothetical protein